jgi:hypothetical protein
MVFIFSCLILGLMRFIAAFLLALLVACTPNPQGTQASAAEAREYVSQLGLEGVEMKASESFGGQELVEITGSILNKGTRALARVELNCVFYDPNGQVILRQSVPMLRTSLKPGEKKAFRLPFDNVPRVWNQTLPQMVMAGIVFE